MAGFFEGWHHRNHLPVPPPMEPVPVDPNPVSSNPDPVNADPLSSSSAPADPAPVGSSPSLGIKDFASLNLTAANGNVLVTLAAGQVLTFEGVALAGITVEDFHFGASDPGPGPGPDPTPDPGIQ